MITMSATALDVVQRSYVLHTRLRSQLDDTILAEDIPVSEGTLEIDRTIRVPERLSFTLPRNDRGLDWDATATPNHPLAPYGQTVILELGVELASGMVEWLQRGEFLISSAEIDGDDVNVTAVGLLALIEEARFVVPFQPNSNSYKTNIRQLVEPALTVKFDSAFYAAPYTTTTLSTSRINWDEDRLGALYEVLDAWPAQAAVDANGVLVVSLSEDPSTSVLTLTDGVGGTIIAWSGASSRDGAYNVVVARGQNDQGATVQGVFYDQNPVSPVRYNGPFHRMPVPYFFSSPLIGTYSQAASAARSVWHRLRRTSAPRIQATGVPHPGLEVGDRVSVVSDLFTGDAIVERISLPITADGGPMTLQLAVIESYLASLPIGFSRGMKYTASS